MLTFGNILLILLMGIGMGMAFMGALWMLQDRDNDEKHKG